MMKTMIGAVILAAITFSNENLLIGKWQTPPVGVNGTITSVNFKPDNSFEGFVNMKPFVTGIYVVKGDTLSFTDNGCDGEPGTYKLIFFSHNDSLRFEPIADECDGRRNGISKMIMGRVK